MEQVQALIKQQLSSWGVARNNYEALQKVCIKEVQVGDIKYKIQFNPARIISSAAKVDKASLEARKCFLCAKNRPDEQQGLPFGGHYEILVNPFPIFPRHLTIPDTQHIPQRILSRFGDMLDLADYLNGFTIFYNGPKCGASAPDHAHFQAGNKGFLPIELEWNIHKTKRTEIKGATLWHIDLFPCPALVIEATEKSAAEKLFDRFYRSMELKEGEDEPMMNLLVWKEKDKWIITLFPREKHRPTCYFTEGENNLLISPASVDMGGVFITPLEKDFKKITSLEVEQILKEVCLSPAKLSEIEQKIISTL